MGGSANLQRWRQVGGLLLASCVALTFVYVYEGYGSKWMPSPWDETPARVVTGVYPCTLPTVLPVDIESSYSFLVPIDATIPNRSLYGVLDLKRVLDPLESAADAYQRSGSTSAARCVLSILSSQAEAGALTAETHNRIAMQLQGLSVGAMAIALLKVESSQSADGWQHSAQVAKIGSWMNRLAHPTEEYYEVDGRASDNSATWAALDLMAVSVASQNPSLFERASNILATSLPTILLRRPEPRFTGTNAGDCSFYIPALAPAAIALKFEVANGIRGAGRDLSELHQIAQDCVDQEVLSSLKSASAARKHESAGTSASLLWMEPYIKELPNPLPASVEPERRLNIEYIGGDLPR